MARHDTAYEHALAFVQKKHRGQFRAGKVPVWHHLLRVSDLLRLTLSDMKEGTPKERRIIALAALGHDLLEDTKATDKEIATVFTKRGLELIHGMTNPHGDADHGPYIRAMASAEEAVRLIKLSDLYDNFTSVVHMLPTVGAQWTNSFFLPITMPMHAAIKKTTFTEYPKTAEHLIRLVDSSVQLLESELRHQAGNSKK
jgi:(p)ppGpp synthase/HD superfamily hydrolase